MNVKRNWLKYTVRPIEVFKVSGHHLYILFIFTFVYSCHRRSRRFRTTCTRHRSRLRVEWLIWSRRRNTYWQVWLPFSPLIVEFMKAVMSSTFFTGWIHNWKYFFENFRSWALLCSTIFFLHNSYSVTKVKIPLCAFRVPDHGQGAVHPHMYGVRGRCSGKFFRVATAVAKRLGVTSTNSQNA